MIDDLMMTIAGDIHRWWGQLETASTKKQVKLLEIIAVNTEHAVNQIRKELDFEHTLKVFNQHGARANPPFGALLVNGRILLANYTSTLGTPMNGIVVDQWFFLHEVAKRWGCGND